MRNIYLCILIINNMNNNNCNIELCFRKIK